MKVKELMAADLFCGGGGTSTGLANACKKRGMDVNLLAINHWEPAINTHTAAHPWARHIRATLDHVKPRNVIPGGRLHILVASPECTSHSRARGGRPKDDQSRATAWDILKWAQELYIDKILIENVEEFMEWGPLGANLKPLKSRKGETFRAFIAALHGLGYTVEYRVLNAADYGAPTSRKRLFIICRRDRKAIVWPEATHSKNGGAGLFKTTKKYRAARECIDWTHKGQSIFTRKKPLKDTTMNRILAGLEKYNPQLEPFLVILRNNMGARSLDDPMPTVTAGGKHIGLAEPFMVNMKGKSTAASIDKPTPTQTTKHHLYLAEPFVIGQQSAAAPRSVDEPMPTIATAGAISVVEPFLTRFNGSHAGRNDGSKRVRSLDDPLSTQDTSNRFGIVEPLILPQFGTAGAKSVDVPLGTLTTTSRGVGLVAPVVMASIVPFFGERKGQKPRSHSVDEPLPAVTSHGAGGLVLPIIVPIDNKSSGASGARSADEPLTTITTEARHAVAHPFLTKYYGTALASSVDEPLDTVTTKGRFGLVMPEVNGYRLEILFRMLQPAELAAAMTFPPNYPFWGTKEQVTAQIGNAVPPDLAEAILTELLSDYEPERKQKRAKPPATKAA